MSAVVLVSLYFVALSAFLGLDILGKVPATLYPLVVAALGTVSAVGLVGALAVAVRSTSRTGDALAIAAGACGALAAGAGLASLGRLARAVARKRQP